MMIIGYTQLHYGTDYLMSALRSLSQFVDRHVIFYSYVPTFGNSTILKCPDSRDDLYECAISVLGNKLIWIEDVKHTYETIFKIYPDTELIFEVDADEIYKPETVTSIYRSYRTGELLSGVYRLPMAHHWRSFNHICHDGSWPVRLSVGQSLIHRGNYPYPVEPMHHFGYCRSVADTLYKMDTSAHKSEWRQGWFENVFMNYPDRLTDLHPVSVGLWNAQDYDKYRLPKFMHKHPNFDKAVVE